MPIQRDSRKWNAVSQSGQPVSRSGPWLIGPTLPPTADRTSETCVDMQQGVCPRPAAQHQPKNAREFEGGALIGGEAAVPLSCFIKKRLIDAAGGALRCQ